MRLKPTLRCDCVRPSMSGKLAPIQATCESNSARVKQLSSRREMEGAWEAQACLLISRALHRSVGRGEAWPARPCWLRPKVAQQFRFHLLQVSHEHTEHQTFDDHERDVCDEYEFRERLPVVLAAEE